MKTVFSPLLFTLNSSSGFRMLYYSINLARRPLQQARRGESGARSPAREARLSISQPDHCAAVESRVSSTSAPTKRHAWRATCPTARE